MGLGGFSTDPQFTGMLGMPGTVESNMAMQNCDVLLAVGTRFDDRVIGNPRIISGPTAASFIDIVRRPFQACQGRRAHRRLRRRRAQNAQLIQTHHQRPDPAARGLVGRDQGMAAQGCLKYDRKSALIKPQMVIEALRNHQGRRVRDFGCRTASDVIRAVLQIRQASPLDQFRRARHEFGLPAAMGVQLANPGTIVACVPVRHRPDVHSGTVDLQAVPPSIKIVNLNNRYMGMVRRWQEFFTATATLNRIWTRSPISSSWRRRMATSE
jgi:acetolactate synthase-1/2/3 large subunit